MVQYIYSEEYRLAHYYVLYNLLISDKKMEIGTYVRGLVDGMWEAVEVIYLTLIKTNYFTLQNKRKFTSLIYNFLFLKWIYFTKKLSICLIKKYNIT